MPIFNVITVNQTHIGKVMVARQHLPEPKSDEFINVSDFQKWRNYITTELKKMKTTATIINHVDWGYKKLEKFRFL